MFEYTERNSENEKTLYDALLTIQKCPAQIIGKKSLTLLFQFVSGYEFAFYDLTKYRLHFEKEFQQFIADKYTSTAAINWGTILLEGRAEEDAFDLFFNEFHTFLSTRAGTF